jgi:hypothetical protein
MESAGYAIESFDSAEQLLASGRFNEVVKTGGPGFIPQGR